MSVGAMLLVGLALLFVTGIFLLARHLIRLSRRNRPFFALKVRAEALAMLGRPRRAIAAWQAVLEECSPRDVETFTAKITALKASLGEA